jgi:hypothetical protein
MVYLKYITEAEFMKILQSVLKLLRMKARHDKKKSVSPHGTAVFFRTHYLLPHLIQYSLLLDELSAVLSTLQC